MRRLVDDAIADDAQEGSVRLELQVDPTSYAPFVGGITPALEIIIDAARESSVAHGVSVGIVVAASRTRHSLDARTLARLAVKYHGDGSGAVVGFGLSNDERSGDTEAFAPAFAIARRAGLASVPHGGELLGPAHVSSVVQHLQPTRLGHGVRLAEDLRLLDRVVASGIALEVCPSSNVSLGVYSTMSDVPLRTLMEHGAQVALGADDPLIFGSRLLRQYELARDVHGLTDAELAGLARSSIEASLASESFKNLQKAAIDRWLAN